MGSYTSIDGDLDASGMRIAIVAGRFNDHVTKPLLEGALGTLRDLGLDDVAVYWVPGAFEIPLVAQRLAPACDAVVCLGAVIRGDTPHFEYVAGAAASGLMNVSVQTGVPVIFGILTTDTMEQALARAGGNVGNKGWEAALAVLEMIDLGSRLEAAGGA